MAKHHFSGIIFNEKNFFVMFCSLLMLVKIERKLKGLFCRAYQSKISFLFFQNRQLDNQYGLLLKPWFVLHHLEKKNQSIR